MEEIFRFMVMRPPETPEPDASIRMRGSTDLVDALRDAVSNDNPARAVRRLVQERAREGYVRSMAELRLGSGLEAVLAALKNLSDGGRGTETKEVVTEIVVSTFGVPIGELAGSEAFSQDTVDSWDSIILVKLNPAEQQTPLAPLASGLRLLELIHRMSDDESSLNWPGGATELLAAPIVLPSGVFPVPAKQLGFQTSPSESVQGTSDTSSTLRVAIEELMSVSTDHLTFETPDSSTPLSAATSRAPDAVSAVLRRLRAGTLRTQHMDQQGPHRIMLSQSGIGKLSSVAANALADAGIDPATTTLATTVSMLEAKLRAESFVTAPDKRLADRSTLVGGSWIKPGFQSEEHEFTPAPSSPTVPTTVGSIAPVGIADLHVVRQQLKAYRVRDVSHIENVLGGESKSRLHERSITTEELLVVETETTTEEERELASTDRFEMRREVAETLREDMRLEGGIRVSGRYGPTTEFETYAQGSVEQSKERSTNQSTQFASEVTDRTVSRVVERIRREVSQRVVRDVRERNKHRLDNRESDSHVRGVYQWVEKVYEAQVFNYGLRTLYDFTVPEPGALYVEALTRSTAEGASLEEPTPLSISPKGITSANYASLVRDYGATDVSAPPEPFVTISKALTGSSASDDPAAQAHDITVPAGYEAIGAYVTLPGWSYSDPDNWMLDFGVGQRHSAFHPTSPHERTLILDSEVGQIPLSAHPFGVASYTVNIEIECRRTARAVETWQLATYASLVQAYERLRSRYESQLAAATMSTALGISGRSPSANRELERTELKRLCISLLTGQQFDLFDAVNEGNGGLPEVDFSQVADEGPYVRFFEHAFEWENIAYVFYPYFWGRKSTWVEHMSYQDVDPTFESFLKAGFARVVVPVRPGFELAVDHFMSTGAPWSGAGLPTVISDLYLPIVEEIRNQTGAPADESPIGAPWDVVVPTELVYLRDDDQLPRWAKNQAGEWVDA